MAIFTVNQYNKDMTNIRKHPEYFNPKFRFPKEIFKDIKDFEDRFMISNHGRLLSINGRIKGSIILPVGIDTEMYYAARLRKYPLYRRTRIHVLVAETFMVKPEGKGVCVNHLDGHKLNNHISNLEWTTNDLNIAHAAKLGLMAYGSDHHNAILNESSVRVIKNFLPKYTNTEIGKMFGVHRRTISDIRLSRTWQRV